VDGRFDADAVAPSVLRRIAAAVGLPDEKVLRRELDDTRAAVREIFMRTLA
jgi:[glutamine synthetase] adenylyltransferase / [glutamine synthetase]-adenylyl-L-tyrosine phosphorylase